MPIHPYVNFNGTCREAVTFYASVFQTEPPQFMTFGDLPEDADFPLPEKAKHLILHTRLTICGSDVLFSDTFPGNHCTVGSHIGLAVMTDSAEKIKRYFQYLSEDGEVEMELQSTEWSPLYASLTDRFGVAWQLNQTSVGGKGRTLP
mgnify:CR=1 FL=1